MDIVMDAGETRQMIEDIIGKPLATLNGQMKVLVQQNASIEVQTRLTNGRVSELEDWQLDVIKQLAAGEIPHHIENCPQGPALKELRDDVSTVKTDISNIKTDVGTIKGVKAAEGSFANVLRSNITVVVIVAGLLLNIILNVRNGKKNDSQLVNQTDLKEQIQTILQDDSTLRQDAKFKLIKK